MIFPANEIPDPFYSRFLAFFFRRFFFFSWSESELLLDELDEEDEDEELDDDEDELELELDESESESELFSGFFPFLGDLKGKEKNKVTF